jgi:glycosyltransferase involved in cell wall biosynthesis
LVLVGPDHLSTSDQRRLDACGNVHRIGPIPYDQVPDYMRAFDVSIVPHLVTPFTESLNPIKLWEYLAAGKPIVSTNVAGFRNYPSHVRIAANAEEFLREVAGALSEDSDRAEARQSEARANSWDSRISEVMRVIASCVVTSKA